jgi:uncharacterized protein YndB with AHSA1/START domain
VSRVRKQAFIDAPVEQIWDLISDIERHPQWWPRVAETEIEGTFEALHEGLPYRQVTHSQFGDRETHLIVEGVDEFRALSIRCVTTGTFVSFDLTEARSGTFVDGAMGMDPRGLGNRIFDVFSGRRYFSKWIEETFAGLERAASPAPPDRARGSG